MSDEEKTTSKTTTAVGELSIAGKNGGRLRNGGTNRGGPGRPPSAIRAAARDRFDHLLPKLDQIARARKSKDSDKISAIGVLGKYGMDRTISIDDVKAALKQQTAEIYEFLPRDQADALIARIRPIWLNL